MLRHTTALYSMLKNTLSKAAGDGTGEFLWPRSQRSDGKWFGFNQEELAKKRAQYLNKVHFRAQYYNDPHDIDSVHRSSGTYFNTTIPISYHGEIITWFFKRERLNVVAAVDFAYTTGKKSDYTSIVVLGTDDTTKLLHLRH
jgi:hypothetical protein